MRAARSETKVTRLCMALAAGLVTALGFALLPGAARADAASCSLSGNVPMPYDLTIYDKSDGGNPIARFTGGSTELGASEFFAGGGQRVRVKTGTGRGSFRIDGWINASDLPIFTNKDVAIVAGHLWIAGQREVRAVSASAGRLRVKKYVGDPFAQTFSASAPCGSLSLRHSTPSGWTPPGEARGYVAKKDVELFDAEGGSLVSVLSPSSSGNGILLFSTEKKGNWVHVLHHSDVVVDAWAKASDLKALPPGETMDQVAAPVVRKGSPKLKLASTPRELTAPKDVAIRDSGSDKGKIIGTVEAGAEVFVMDIVAGWASVMPKSLNVAPHGDGQFWAKASDLGASP